MQRALWHQCCANAAVCACAHILLLELPGQFVPYWFTLFSVAACANMFGLVISLLFNSVRVIYLAIPLFIIPQLMLGGAIVTFDQLQPQLCPNLLEYRPWGR